ncbi:hypothetical protein [Epilithonimonas sp.]|nr:hypothetical protein [Epilithonimonas sp.]
MKIIWTDFAIQNLKDIFDYYYKNEIRIVDIFDTSQNPIKIEREK